MKIVFYLSILLPALLLSGNSFAQDLDSSFKITLNDEEEITEFSGDDIFFSITQSSLSILINSEEIRCGHHFTSLRERLEPGTYKTQYDESPRFGAVCFILSSDEPERLASESGTITIDEYTSKRIIGSFDIVFRGGVTEKEYKLSGEFDAISAE
jgi:hypothetical protein